MDIIFIEHLAVNSIIGIHNWEKENPQPLIIDIEIGTSTRKAAQSDNIQDSIDYFAVSERIRQFSDEHQFELLEAFAEAIATILLEEFQAQQVKIKVSKPHAVKDANVGVIIERSLL